MSDTRHRDSERACAAGPCSFTIGCTAEVVSEPGDAGDQREDIAPFVTGFAPVEEGIWGTTFMGAGIFVVTTGKVSDEMVAEYIENQDIELEGDDGFKITE
jgi:hypothetical protein